MSCQTPSGHTGLPTKQLGEPTGSAVLCRPPGVPSESRTGVSTYLHPEVRGYLRQPTRAQQPHPCSVGRSGAAPSSPPNTSASSANGCFCVACLWPKGTPWARRREVSPVDSDLSGVCGNTAGAGRGARRGLLGLRPPHPCACIPQSGVPGPGGLPSRCAGPRPGSPCLGGPPCAAAVSAGRPCIPRWARRPAARTWGCWGSHCSSGSLPPTGP